jgi:hypothetical protein
MNAQEGFESVLNAEKVCRILSVANYHHFNLAFFMYNLGRVGA